MRLPKSIPGWMPESIIAMPTCGVEYCDKTLSSDWRTPSVENNGAWRCCALAASVNRPNVELLEVDSNWCPSTVALSDTETALPERTSHLRSSHPTSAA